MSITDVTEDDCDVFLTSLRARKLAASTRNKYLQLLKAMSAWGVRKGYLIGPWIMPGSDLKREKIAKNRKLRHIPIVARLRAVLEMARHDPAGHPFGPDDYVFGDEVGRRLTSPQKAWETAVLKAHGQTPTWVRGGLSPASRDAYRTIDFHFHDLRHEAGSRWLEQGLPLHHVKALLGHASISTTDTYLNASRIHLRESMLEMEQRGKSDTNVPQILPRRPDQGVQQRPKNTGKLLLH